MCQQSKLTWMRRKIEVNIINVGENGQSIRAGYEFSLTL